MELANDRIVGLVSSPAFQGLISNKSLPAKVAFRIALMAKKLGEVADQFFKTRQEKLEQYAEKGDDGKAKVEDGNYKILPEFAKKLGEEIDELRKEVVTIEADKVRIKLKDLPDGILSPVEMVVLQDIIEFDE